MYSKYPAGHRLHSPAVPDHQRFYAIGDIHGRADLLRKMHRAVLKHAAIARPAENHIIYLGDYVDRGLQVKETMDILTSDPLPGFASVFLKGNHEEMLLAFLADAAVFEEWLSIGGQATLLSYGVNIFKHAPHPVRAEGLRRTFQQVFPKVHHDFLMNLKINFRAGDYLFAHAGLRPGVPLDKQQPEDFIWIREPFLSSRKHSELRVVHGHHITARPEMSAHRIGVDTGAYATGRLSCVVLEADQAEFITVQADGNG